MTDDLVKEMRRFSFHDRINEKPWEAVELMDAAADRIEELEARVEWAEGYLRGALDVVEAFSHADTSKARAALEGKHD